MHRGRLPSFFTKELLEEEAYVNKLRSEEIAEKYNYRVEQVRIKLKEYNIKCRRLPPANADEKNLVNKKFNKLSVISKAYVDKRDCSTYFNCKCDCGKDCIKKGSDVKSGHTKSCGNCPKTDIIPQFIFGKISNNASQRKIHFNITKSDIEQLWINQNGKCALSGVDIHISQKIKELHTLTTASLDRIDNNIGYELNNIQWVHKWINIIKYTMEVNKLIQICNNINEFYYNKTTIIDKLEFDDNQFYISRKIQDCYKLITNTFYSRIKKVHLTKNIEFNLTKEELWEIYKQQKGLCSYSGTKLHFPTHTKDYNYNISLDRIDSNKPCIKGNVQWITKDINFMKNDFTQLEFLEWCKIITEYNRN